jgi:hypothetical protein
VPRIFYTEKIVTAGFKWLNSGKLWQYCALCKTCEPRISCNKSLKIEFVPRSKPSWVYFTKNKRLVPCRHITAVYCILLYCIVLYCIVSPDRPVRSESLCLYTCIKRIKWPCASSGITRWKPMKRWVEVLLHAFLASSQDRAGRFSSCYGRFISGNSDADLLMGPRRRFG